MSIQSYKKDMTFRKPIFYKIWKFSMVFFSDFLHRTARKLDNDFHFADFQESYLLHRFL
jgi:hypothetical protein